MASTWAAGAAGGGRRWRRRRQAAACYSSRAVAAMKSLRHQVLAEAARRALQGLWRAGRVPDSLGAPRTL